MKEKQFIWLFWRYMALAAIAATLGCCNTAPTGIVTLVPPVIVVARDSVRDGNGMTHPLSTSDKTKYATAFLDNGDTLISGD